ncbi:MAG: peptide/nickel transport system permease protein, partial [Dinoroseobacter sp.]
MKRNLILGGTLSAIFSLAALISFLWTPYDVTTLDIAGKLAEPSAQNLLGTDHFGRDILSMLMVGARISIAVALAAVG